MKSSKADSETTRSNLKFNCERRDKDNIESSYTLFLRYTKPGDYTQSRLGGGGYVTYITPTEKPSPDLDRDFTTE